MDKRRLLVTGATGLVGSNLCIMARQAGYEVRALVRASADADVLAGQGIEAFIGDIRHPDSLLRVADGVQGIIHTAALLAGTWSTSSDSEFWDTNYRGTLNVFDAAMAAGPCRVVDIDTLAILDWTTTITERSPIVPIRHGDIAYLASKRASYYAGMHRASLDEDIVFITPGAVYGPSLFVDRALHPTSFTGALAKALTGKLDSYASLPLLWAYAKDVAATSLAAFERGTRGMRYLACGRAEDARSLGGFCNLGAEIAGVRFRVRDIPPSAAAYGKQSSLAGRTYADPMIDASETASALGVHPVSLAEGLRQTVDWLEANKRIQTREGS